MKQLLAVAAVGVLWCASCAAQQPGLDELQRRLDAAKHAQQQREAAQKEEAVPRAAAACEGDPKRMVDQGGGVLRQCVSELLWSQSDNGADVNWRDAGQYCASKGEAWSLPTVQELQGLYDASSTLTTRCSSYTCKVSPLFRLSGPLAWSSEQDGSSGAWFVGLARGNRNSTGVDHFFNARALCVRRP